ncbi:MAG: alpha/beta hydrolase fold domain-containing protein [Paracoccaceae bacterium]
MTQAATDQPTSRAHTGTAIPLPEVPPDVDVIRDIAFGPHERQAYDVYLPRNAPRPMPVAVFFHPGAWSRRDKQAVRTMFLLEHGFAIVSIGYRLAQHARFPAQVCDANDGIRHLLAHAEGYGIDPSRLVLTGTSAGAHLASLVALATGHAAFHPLPDLNPRAVVAIYGAYDLAALVNNQKDMEIDHTSAASPMGVMFGEAPAGRPDLLREISPQTYVRPGLPPVFLLHGRDDKVLPWSQSADFARALIAAGSEVTLKILPGEGHGAEAFRTPPISDEITAFVKRVTARH